MKAKLHYIEYNRRKSVKRFVLQCQPWNEKSDTIVGFDVNDLMSDALQDDINKGYEALKGPAFGFEVYRALNAGQSHIEVSRKWINSVKSQDQDFLDFVQSHMNNARSSVDFFNTIENMRSKQNLPNKSMIDMKDIDMLDFRPMIGYKGIWKNFRQEYVNILKSWENNGTTS